MSAKKPAEHHPPTLFDLFCSGRRTLLWQALCLQGWFKFNVEVLFTSCSSIFDLWLLEAPCTVKSVSQSRLTHTLVAFTLWAVTCTLGKTPNLALLSTEEATRTDVSHCRFSYSSGYYTLIGVHHSPRYVCGSLYLCDLSLSSCAFVCDAPVAFVW